MIADIACRVCLYMLLTMTAAAVVIGLQTCWLGPIWYRMLSREQNAVTSSAHKDNQCASAMGHFTPPPPPPYD